MQSPEYLEALTSYYKLKEKYENKYNKDKLKIINNSAYSLKEKQVKFKQLKRYCINCKQEGGTIFTHKDNKLKAICGHTQKPCKLNIELEKGLYINSEDLADTLKEEIEKKKTDLIKIKLDFLFGYISEEEALAKFNILKKEIFENDNTYATVENFYLNITDNKYKKDLLEAAKKDLYEEIQNIKNFCKVYALNYNKTLLSNAVEVYIEKVLPLVSTISDLEYIYRVIDKNDEENVLIEKAYTLASLEYPVQKSRVIFNKQ